MESSIKSKHWHVDLEEIEKPNPKLSSPSTSVILTDEELKKEYSQISPKSFDWVDRYKIIVETRKFEIENFWKRSLFFWGTIAILLAGYFNAKEYSKYLIFVSYIGFFYTLIFSFSLRGSKFWQDHWELLANLYEEKINIRLFRWDSHKTINKVREKDFPLLRPFRFSVSKLTMILSDLTTFFWLILIIKDYKELLNKKLIHFDISIDNEIHFFTIATIIIPIIFIIYLLIFVIKDYNKYKGKLSNERS